MRSRMSSNLDLSEPELSELSDLELKKIAIFDFVHNLVSANIHQSAPILVKIYMTNRSRIHLIMGLIGPEHLELFAL